MVTLSFLSYTLKGIPILMYHYLGDTTDKQDTPYYVSRNNFYRQMKYLRHGGYKSISLQQLIDGINNRSSVPKRSVVITFDDGHESFAQIGAPILESFGFTATMFIITRRIGNPSYLSKTSIRELGGRGFHFESHSLTHPIITRIPLEEAKTEIFDSKKELESISGRKVNFFAYRGGHYNADIIELVRQAGYFSAVCSEPGLNTKNTNLYCLKRMAIRGGDNLGHFSKKLHGNNIWRPTVSHIVHYTRL